MSENQNQNKNKRKRLKNTTVEQYEAYLNFMENDYVFRSNTINPTVEPDYLNKKWQELTNSLNYMGNGPALSVEEWKKRFADWKYSTKTKSRKINEDARRTGGGPKLNLELTAVEERGLAIWGKITVEGSRNTEYDGLGELPPTNSRSEQDIMIFESDEIVGSLNVTEPEDVLPSMDVSAAEITLDKENINISPKPSTSKVRVRGKRTKPLSVLAENLIKVTDSASDSNKEFHTAIKTFCEEYIHVQKKKLHLEEEKLKFKIAKFKFKNQEFDF